MRNSPSVLLAEQLIGKGIDVHIYDPKVVPEYLMGRNKYFLESKIPHIVRNFKNSPFECIQMVEAIVICLNSLEVKNAINNIKDKLIIDLIGLENFSDEFNKIIRIGW